MRLVCSLIFFLFLISCSVELETVEFNCGEGQLQNCNDCSDEFIPVCGCDKATYINVCKANCNGIYEYTQGECP